jgi:hypothetical protein
MGLISAAAPYPWEWLCSLSTQGYPAQEIMSQHYQEHLPQSLCIYLEVADFQSQ